MLPAPVALMVDFCAFLLDGCGNLRDGVGDDVKGVHVDEDNWELDCNDFAVGGADDHIEEVAHFEVLAAFDCGVATW